ncbi:MAG: hypothetical protein ACFCU1_05155 [Sumerlaeia bacterium]
MRRAMIYCLLASAALLSGCYNTRTTTVDSLNPYRADGLTPKKVGNVELIVSNVDPSIMSPRVLVEIVPSGTNNEELEGVRRRLMYNELPKADARMLVQSNYTIEPGTYEIFFWEEFTGTMSKRRLTISEENNYIVAFFRTKIDKDGEANRQFRILSSNKPVMDGYSPLEVGRF